MDHDSHEMREDGFTNEESRRAWDELAQRYDELVDSDEDFLRSDVMGPGLVAACGDVSGLRVLDLGCGQGFFSRILAAAGASVVGVDLSDGQIANARRRDDEHRLGIEYVVGDAATLDALLPAGHFDLVASCIALHDMADCAGVLRSARAVLRTGGRIVVLVEHPMNTTRLREWERDEHRRRIALRIDGYFDTGPHVPERMGPLRHYVFPTWRRTLEEWSALFADAGLAIHRLYEPRPTAEQVRQDERLSGSARIAYFLVFDLAVP